VQKKTSPGFEPKTDFRGCGVYSCNFLVKTNNFGLGDVLLSCLVSDYRNHLHRDSNPGQFFGIITCVPVIISSTQTTLVMATFFYRAYFPSYRNLPHRDSNLGHLFSEFGLSKHKHAKFGRNRKSCSRAISQHTHTRHFNFMHKKITF
jgi:hypothetical protein